jgi:hypothetical protein
MRNNDITWKTPIREARKLIGEEVSDDGLLPKYVGKDTIIEAQNEIVFDPRLAFKSWMRNVARINPILAEQMRHNVYEVPKMFHEYLVQVTGKMAADILYEKYFSNLNEDVSAPILKKTVKESVKKTFSSLINEIQDTELDEQEFEIIHETNIKKFEDVVLEAENLIDVITRISNTGETEIIKHDDNTVSQIDEDKATLLVELFETLNDRNQRKAVDMISENQKGLKTIMGFANQLTESAKRPKRVQTFLTALKSVLSGVKIPKGYKVPGAVLKAISKVANKHDDKSLTKLRDALQDYRDTLVTALSDSHVDDKVLSDKNELKKVRSMSAELKDYIANLEAVLDDSSLLDETQYNKKVGKTIDDLDNKMKVTPGMVVPAPNGSRGWTYTVLQDGVPHINHNNTFSQAGIAKGAMRSFVDEHNR